MPRAQSRTFTTGADQPIMPTVHGTGTTRTRTRGRTRGVTAANSVASATRGGKQYLSLDRTDANHVIAKDLTAGGSPAPLHTNLGGEEKQTGGVAQKPPRAVNTRGQEFCAGLSGLAVLSGRRRVGGGSA